MSEVPNQSKGGCLKVLAIGGPILLLMAFLFWKVAAASGRAEDVAARVTTPYLEEVRAGHYQRALEQYGSDEHRAEVSAEALKAAYEDLIQKWGPIQSIELFRAQEEHQLFGESIVQVRYLIHQERATSHVFYDIAGEGAAAKIQRSYERPGTDTLRPAPR